jgi:hypothetical protein
MRKLGVQTGNSDSKMMWTSILLSLVFGLLTACASHTPPAPKTVESDAASSNKPPMVIQNPDGTFTVQKEPPKGEAENANDQKGLVVPPQVVVPITLAPKNENSERLPASH